MVIRRNMATRFLSKMSKRRYDRLFTDSIGIAAIGVFTTECRKLANRSKKTSVGIFWRRHLSQKIPFAFWEDAFHTFHVFRVTGRPRNNCLNDGI